MGARARTGSRPTATRSSPAPGGPPARTTNGPVRASPATCPGTARRAGPRRSTHPVGSGIPPCSDGSAQSRTSRRPPGRERRPGRTQRALRVVQRRGARTGSRRGRTAIGWPEPVDVRLRGSRFGRSIPPRATCAPARAAESGSNSSPTSSSGREPPGHGDQPATAAAVDVDDSTPAGQVTDQLRKLGEGLLEEDRDVLDGQPLDRLSLAIRALA